MANLSNSTKEIQSCYKLNNSIVKRLVSRQLILKDGKVVPGCSKLMIAAMIHFSHICSPEGIIEEYRVKDLELVLRCSNRAAYKVLKALQERDFIRFETLDYWAGIKSIKLLDNDFSAYQDSDYKKSRYLNTNFPFFNYRENQGYDDFLNLSLFAMRLFLCILHNYSFNKGYHSSFETLCHHIGIKTKRLIHHYITEFKTILPENQCQIQEKPNPVRRSPYGSISLHAHQVLLSSHNNTIKETNDTYYTTRWKMKFVRLGLYCDLTTGFTLHSFCNRIAKIVNFHLTKSKLNLALIETTVWNLITDDPVLDEQLLTQIDQRLRSLAF